MGISTNQQRICFFAGYLRLAIVAARQPIHDFSPGLYSIIHVILPDIWVIYG